MSQCPALSTAAWGLTVGSRIIPNYLADRAFGPLNLFVPCTLATGVLLLCWPAVSSPAGLIVWAVFYGIFAAGILSLFPATLSSLTTDLTKSGTRWATSFDSLFLPWGRGADADVG